MPRHVSARAPKTLRSGRTSTLISERARFVPRFRDFPALAELAFPHPMRVFTGVVAISPAGIALAFRKDTREHDRPRALRFKRNRGLSASRGFTRRHATN